MFSIPSTDTSPAVTIVVIAPHTRIYSSASALQNALFGLLKHKTLKEKERKDKDTVLQIASIFSFDNFNNVNTTVLENQKISLMHQQTCYILIVTIAN